MKARELLKQSVYEKKIYVCSNKVDRSMSEQRFVVSTSIVVICHQVYG